VFEFLLARPDQSDPFVEPLFPGKVLIGQGMLRITPAGEGVIDAPATFYGTFPQFGTFGPYSTLTDPYELIFWTPTEVFPFAIPVPSTFVSPITPPGFSGTDLVLGSGLFPALVPWQGMNKLFPGTGWAQGTDVKVLDQDASVSVTARMIRLRPGRKTPPFSITGNTHIIVLQGSVQIGPAGGLAKTLTSNQYAFVPPGFSISLANPAVYTGPGGSN
jgi:hypothetical protein